MQLIKRRDFMKQSAAVTAGLMTASVPSRILGANEDIRVGVIGVGLNGSNLAERISRIRGTRLVAMADPDPAYQMQSLKDKLAGADNPVHVETMTDFRRLLDRKDIDAVIIASCNHWHVLHSIYALQAGKHVYVEKPVSHNVWEGRQLLNLVNKTDLVVETGVHHRSRECWPQIREFLKEGKLGRVLVSRGLCYRLRDGIGKLDTPRKPPSTCDYDLWLGPAADEPLMRPQFHYDWHWVWNTGNGDIGNQGIHQVDISRWLIDEYRYPEHIFSIGGRLGVDDAAETPNTQVIYFDYKPIPLIFEVRNLPVEPGIRAMPVYKNARVGSILECEEGFISESAAYDKNGRRIQQFEDRGGGNHLPNFIEAVRSNRPDKVACPIRDSHLSSALCHFGNISHRIGQAASPVKIAEIIQYNPLVAEAWHRCLENLKINKVDVQKDNVVLGAVLRIDNDAEQITGPFAELGNPLLKRTGRSPWVIPEIT